MILVADAAVGLAAVAAIVAAPWVSARLDAERAAAIGVPLVLALPLLVVAGPRFGGTPLVNQTLFMAALAAFVAGSIILVMAHGDDNGGGGGGGDAPVDPPWWPEFERDFRRYARRVRVRA